MQELQSPSVREAACPQCGAVFHCGARAGACWCQDLPPVTVLADGDCLCPACLTAAAERSDPGTASS